MKTIKKTHLIYQHPKTPAAIFKAERVKRTREIEKIVAFQASENEKLAQIRALAAQLNLP